MKRISVGLLSGLLFLVLASSVSFAQMCSPAGEGMASMHHDGRGMMKKDHYLWRRLAGLGLDEKQMAAVKEIRSRVAKESVRKRAELQIARIDLRDVLDKDQVDMTAVEGGLKRMASIQTDMRLSHVKAMQEIKAILTPDQRKKFKDMRGKGPIAERTMHGSRGATPPIGEQTGTVQEES